MDSPNNEETEANLLKKYDKIESQVYQHLFE
eukprot:CAMPEP_0116884782 /NCGR_PEP_ID=MMETSP0463-20121206/17801_1 /TAXON_ID=181622 /ORGANISM="Strombidinopsis sp, Strain SopsisLIS2011" /LENGTH=30 /DNA_ID= /DNA_START= /DNA_END= /DNA_ORIENTATION=